ncbi:hypothetical protein Tco_1022187 [Tanacetum coccineum]
MGNNCKDFNRKQNQESPKLDTEEKARQANFYVSIWLSDKQQRQLQQPHLHLYKASSEYTLSNGTSINQSLQLQDVNIMEVSNYHIFEDPSLKNQTLFRPTLHVGAFPVCSPPNGFSAKCVIPSRCGHGCCFVSGHGTNYQTLLLGPDFIDYEELALYSNQELATIAKYGNKWAIIAKLLRDLA